MMGHVMVQAAEVVGAGWVAKVVTCGQLLPLPLKALLAPPTLPFPTADSARASLGTQATAMSL